MYSFVGVFRVSHSQFQFQLFPIQSNLISSHLSSSPSYPSPLLSIVSQSASQNIAAFTKYPPNAGSGLDLHWQVLLVQFCIAWCDFPSGSWVLGTGLLGSGFWVVQSLNWIGWGGRRYFRGRDGEWWYKFIYIWRIPSFLPQSPCSASVLDFSSSIDRHRFTICRRSGYWTED